MRGVAAPRGVATVSYYYVRRRHRAVSLAFETERPSEAVRAYLLPAECHGAIAAAAYAPLPKQAPPFGGGGGNAGESEGDEIVFDFVHAAILARSRAEGNCFFLS